MNIKFSVILLLICFFISSCCQYAKVDYRTCDCKDYFSFLQKSFYLEEETGKRIIVASEEEDISRFIELVRSNAVCFKGMGLKDIQKVFGKKPDQIVEKWNRITYTLSTNLNIKNTRLHPNILNIVYGNTNNEVYEILIEQIPASGDLYQYTLRLLSEDRAPKK